MTSRVATFSLLVCLGGCCLDAVSDVESKPIRGGHSTGDGSTVAGTTTGGARASGAGTTGTGSGAGTSTGGSTTGSSTSNGTSTGSSKIPVGPCTSDDACLSGVCGINGSGHCCQKSCTNVTSPCGATDCDADTGACLYPDSKVSCGGAPKCDGNTLISAAFCDGLGDCQAASRACNTGTFCDAVGVTCCTGLSEGGAMSVDNATGEDLGCCGFGGNSPCRTLSRAVQLVDAAHARRTTITATVKGGGGDWKNGETYPIVLGWGVELSAAGVSFYDPSGASAIFDINNYSNDDTVGFATIVGSAAFPVEVGRNLAGVESPDSSSILVESRDTLYLANANVESSEAHQTTAITVMPGGTLQLAHDLSGQVTGTVYVGSVDGWNGVVCPAGQNLLGCTITDQSASLDGGRSSLVIKDQLNIDLDAEDNASVTLHWAPIIGNSPNQPGIGECQLKRDTGTSDGPAILIRGNAAMTLWGATVQCIKGTAISMESSADGSSPSLSLVDASILNSAVGLHASAGNASVSDSSFLYNGIGVWQDGDAQVQVSGLSTLACSSGAEVGQSGGGVSALNTSGTGLSAEDVAWDTPGPDLFSCDSQLDTCTCEAVSCTEAGGTGEDMDAVSVSGAIDTTSPLAPVTCP